ncbi:MAG: ribonuclease P [Crenarchaeota archaeon]|nr:ribonuclease P [Thermoproteota archaeon]
MRRKSKRRKRLLRDLVRQRAEILYGIARDEARRGNLEYASRLGSLIKQLSQSTGVRLPRSLKRNLCKNCSLPLIPGVTATYRLRSQGRFSYIVIKCVRCGWIHRRPYKKGVSVGEDSR